jgi:undecaprenyl-diphosphatase
MSIVMAALAAVGCVVCVKFAPASIAATGKADPREVVVDEFAGQAITFLLVAGTTADQIWRFPLATAVVGFLLFRFFDIVKPWPARRFEKLPAGWGVLADDLWVAIYAGIALIVCLRAGLVEYINGLVRFDVSSLNIFSSAVLGAVQGLTEFLPVSSSGHLVLFETFFGFEPERPEMLLFDIAVHVGTVAAIFIVFRKSIAAFSRNLLVCGKYGTTASEIYKESPAVHTLSLAVLATVVTAVLGLLFKEYFASARGNLAVVALMWLVTGTLLLITDWRKRTRLGLRQFGIWQAVVVGLAQTAAIMPGISRSGATICAAILIGLHRRWAVEFSFLLAIPAILGAAVIQLVGDFEKLGSATLPISCVLTGSIVAAAVGVLALKALIRVSRTAKLKFFAFYCYILSFFLLVYLLR